MQCLQDTATSAIKWCEESHCDNDRRLEVIGGTVPTLRGDIAPGCRFAPRCPFVKPVCTEKDPVLKEVKPGHKVSCWLY